MLYHFSEDPNIKKFEPRVHPSHPEKPPLVWAIDEERAPLYFFPRDCPRIGFWATPETTSKDRERFLAHTNAGKVIAMEGRWLEKMMQTELYIYHLPKRTFECHDDGAGYYTTQETVIPEYVETSGNLMNRMINADVELRLTPSLKPLSENLVSSTLHFSMIRMRNAIL